jgi:hypothetical protein
MEHQSKGGGLLPDPERTRMLLSTFPQHTGSSVEMVSWVSNRPGIGGGLLLGRAMLGFVGGFEERAVLARGRSGLRGGSDGRSLAVTAVWWRFKHGTPANQDSFSDPGVPTNPSFVSWWSPTYTKKKGIIQLPPQANAPCYKIP